MFPLPPFLALFRASLLSGTALLARGEPAGLFTDFTVADQTKAVLVRNNGDTYSNPDGPFTNAGTSPKFGLYDVTGTLVWSPHNLAVQSDDISTSWSRTGLTAPSSSELRETATTVYHEIIQTITTISGAVYTVSVELKYNGRQWVYVGLGGAFSTFDVQNGALGANDSGNSSTITDMGGGWYRCAVTRTVSSATPLLELGPGNSSASATQYAGDITKGLFVRKAQINRGTVPTAYLATTSAARFGLAIDYDPVTHACKGLLVEAAATNLLLQSQAFDDATWTKGNSTISANVVVAPNGSSTADKLAETTATGSHNVIQNATVSSGAAYTISVFAKAAERSVLLIYNATLGSGKFFDLSNGSILGNQDTAPAGATITGLGAGWYRCSITFTTASTAVETRFYSCLDATTFSFAGTTGSGLYLWQAQLELGSVATSPIPTFAATVTRARDLPNYLLSTIPSVATAVGMFVEFQQTAQESTVTRVISLDDGTTGTRAFIAVTTSALRGGAVVSTVAQATIDVGTTAVNVTQKAAFSAALNDFRFAAGGVLGVPDVSGTYPSVTTGRLGYDAQSQALVGGLYIQKFGIVPRTLTDAELQARST